MSRGRPFNDDSFWYDGMYPLLEASARTVMSKMHYVGDIEELISIGWLYQGRHCSSIANAKKYLFLNAKREMAKWIKKEQEYLQRIESDGM